MLGMQLFNHKCMYVLRDTALPTKFYKLLLGVSQRLNLDWAVQIKNDKTFLMTILIYTSVYQSRVNYFFSFLSCS